MAVAVAGRAVLTVLASGDLATADTIANLGAAIAAVLYATLGALIVRRAGNVTGWFLLGAGPAWLPVVRLGLCGAGRQPPGTLPAPALVALLAEWSFVPVLAAIAFMLLLFPTGTLPSPRWRPFAGWRCWPPR